MSSDFDYGKYAENEEEEAQAEDVYDRIRDDNTETLMENIKQLLDNTKNLCYYKHRKEGLAKDIIQFVLEELKLKIESVDTYGENFQVINLEEKKKKISV